MVENSKQIHGQIKKYRNILRQIRYLRKQKNIILSELDRATRGEKFWDEDTEHNIDRIDREIRKRC